MKLLEFKTAQMQRGETAEEKELIAWLIKHAPVNAMSHIDLYRGRDTRGEMYITDSRAKGMRHPQNTIGYCSLYQQYGSQWSRFPRRGNSIIATTSKVYSSQYGETYNIIPKDGTVLAICPDIDWWNSFEWSNLQKATTAAEAQASEYSRFWGDSVEDIDRVFNTIPKLAKLRINTNYNEQSYHKMVEILKAHNLFDPLVLDLNPKKFKKVATLDDLLPYKDNEVWFDGVAAFVRADIWRDVQAKVKKKLLSPKAASKKPLK